MTEHKIGQRRIRRVPWKARDMERAMKSARAQGMEVGTVEVRCKDGTIITIHAKDSHRETVDTPETISDASIDIADEK
jgi:hypothetical protein